MTFNDLIEAILNSYITENPDCANVYIDQINGLVRVDGEINGYGAYANFTLKPDCLRFTDKADGYGRNDYYVIMEGRKNELGFVLAISDGRIQQLEIFPNDGEAWDGVVRPFRLSKLPFTCMFTQADQSIVSRLMWPLSSGLRPVNHSSSRIDTDRPLSPQETTLLRWLLDQGSGDNAVFVEQLQHARVVGLCSCGCASIDLSVDGRLPESSEMVVLSDFQWRTQEGHLFGAFVFGQGGRLAGLELWSIDGQSTPGSLPPIDRLEPLNSVSQA